MKWSVGEVQKLFIWCCKIARMKNCRKGAMASRLKFPFEIEVQVHFKKSASEVLLQCKWRELYDVVRLQERRIAVEGAMAGRLKSPFQCAFLLRFADDYYTTIKLSHLRSENWCLNKIFKILDCELRSR